MTVTRAIRPDLAEVVDLLERQRSDGWHDGAQCYVSHRGEVLLDVAIGESRARRPLDRDDMMLLDSAGKPMTTVAVLELGDRVVPVVWKGHAMPVRDADGGIRMVPYRVDEIHNEPWFITKAEPGGGVRAPAHELGRFYESLLGYGPSLLQSGTVEVMG